MAEITKDSTLREVLTSYANKNKRGSSFVTEGVKLFKDIADKKGSALQLFTPDKSGKTLISKKIEERKTLNVIDKKDIGSGLKQPMQNLRQVGLSLKTVIPESDKSYAYLPDKESSTPKNEKIFGTLEPAKAKAMVAVNPNPKVLQELFSKIAEFKKDPKLEAIADATLFNLQNGLRPNAAAGLEVSAYYPESGSIFIPADAEGAKGRMISVPIGDLGDSILQKRISENKVKEVNGVKQFFVKPNGKVVRSGDMTDLLKSIKVPNILYDQKSKKFFDSLAPLDKDAPGKTGSSLFRNIHAKLGQMAGIPDTQVAYLEGRSLAGVAKGATGELVTYRTDFPGAIDPKGIDAQNANKISSIFAPVATKYGFDISGEVPRITKATEGFSTYFDAPVANEAEVKITNNGNTLLDSKVQVSGIEDFSAEEIEELKSGGINLEPSTTKKVLKGAGKAALTTVATLGTTVAKSSPLVAAGLEYQMSKDEGKGEFESGARGLAEAVNPLPVGIREFEGAEKFVAEKARDDSSISDSGSFLDALTGSLTGQSLNLSGGYASGGFINKAE
tara:strand:- start:996 stop:2675 length:1680 start_codon:yes stop_codon:yes gene_type:complete